MSEQPTWAEGSIHSSTARQEIPQHEPGAKLDTGKADMSLLLFFSNALEQVATVGTMGATKYTRGGFLEVPDGVNRYTAAMLRHMMNEWQGMDTDDWYDTPEGAPFKGTIRHDAQTAWNALARLELRLREEANGSSD